MGSLVSALERRGAAFIVTSEPAEIERAQAAILPGDGAFGATSAALAQRGLDGAVRAAIAQGKPFLGICVGMQLLFDRSEEFGDHAGLGVFTGVVTRFVQAPRVPHMGWNRLDVLAEHPFVHGLATGSYAYFLHSYRAAVGPYTIASSEHGDRFSAIEARGNVMATQFHPEKSGATGAVLIDNFIALARVAA
jgi:glutamine amidotransferase